MSKLELASNLAYTLTRERSDRAARGQVAIFPGGPSPPGRGLVHRLAKQTAYGSLANILRGCLRRRRRLAGYHALSARIPSGHETGRRPGADDRGISIAES